jgi:hypothetical protein
LTGQEMPALRHIEMPVTPDAKIVLRIRGDSDLLTPLPALGDGFTVRFKGDVWRSVVRTLTTDDDGYLIELAIEGRYEGAVS